MSDTIPSCHTLLTLFFLLCTGFLLYMALGNLLVRRRGFLFRASLLAVCSIMSCMVIFLGDPTNILPTFTAFLLAVYFCCEGSPMKRIVLGFMFASTIFSFNALMDNYVTNVHAPYYHKATLTALRRILFCSVLFGFTKYFSPKNDFELAPAMWRLLFLLTLTPAGIVFSLVLLSPSNAPRDTLQFFILLLLSLLAFISLLWTVIVLVRQQRLEQEAVAAEMNRKYYEGMEQQNFEIRRLRHDMANHLQTLASLSAEKKDDYIRELLRLPGFSRTLKYCRDDTVNAVLSTKAAVMEQNGILFHVKADIARTLSLEKPDICAIFGNALDNAAEAVKALPDGQRTITLDTRLGKGMLVLHVTNPYPGNAAASTTTLTDITTTKKDKSAHGFGLRSIRKAAEKYDGRMDIKIEDGQFELFVYVRADSTPLYHHAAHPPN